ncbi:MAG: hypothetical protein UIL37_06030 [Clostridia bacterium]|nr:hypothetical protein [Clostridia bacterium]
MNSTENFKNFPDSITEQGKYIPFDGQLPNVQVSGTSEITSLAVEYKLLDKNNDLIIDKQIDRIGILVPLNDDFFAKNTDVSFVKVRIFVAIPDSIVKKDSDEHRILCYLRHADLDLTKGGIQYLETSDIVFSSYSGLVVGFNILYIQHSDGTRHTGNFCDLRYNSALLQNTVCDLSAICENGFFTNANIYYSSCIQDMSKAYGVSIKALEKADEMPAAYSVLEYFEQSSPADSSKNAGAAEVLKTAPCQNQVVICCTGDSVTEGMATNGAHYSRYGEASYPARLYTLLKDNGYENVTVINQGHGGERCAEIAVRIGGFPCYFSESVTIPADNSKVSLGQMTAEEGRATGTKIKIPYSDKNGEDYCVYFTQTSHDTNPLIIDGIEYNLSVVDSTNYIKKVVSDGVETTIPKGTLLFTNDNVSPDVNVIYGGINDGPSLTLERWIDTMKACGAVNGNKYIILGSTHALWEKWADLTGTEEEKYEKYKRKCMEAFGVHFIDLYDCFARHALDYALSAGYYSDKTEAELEDMRTKLSNHIIPAEMTFNGEAEGDVHLSEEGYHVIAMLVFTRLKALNYI